MNRMGGHGSERKAVGTVAGMQIFVDPGMVKQFRFPSSKKRRIRRKWSKRPGNFRPCPDMFVIRGQSVVGHPMYVGRLLEELRRRERLEAQ